jgi:E3 ubiquitin-protein ligase UBR3
MEELEQLERAFSIPPLPDILAQDKVHGLVLSWCKHVKNDSGMHIPPRLTTAAPFQMMRLPHLFQELLQWYIFLSQNLLTSQLLTFVVHFNKGKLELC